MNLHGPIPPTPPSVAAQIARLPELPMTEIRALWKRLYDREAPIHGRRFLEKRIAYKLQEIEFRKVNPGLLERNRRRIEALIEAGEKKKPERGVRLMAGTVLTREYQGVEHRVTVIQDGRYDFEGRLYPSLSMIAREITGTRWSGPLFFGLKATTKPKNGGRR
ncbi:MAG: DUF2924 domain-containing protein [bacterium]